MTDDIITIYLDPIADKKLIHDQELFNTGSNKSELTRKIIINYYSKYEVNINELKQKIKNAVKNETKNQKFDEDEYLNIAWKITKYLCEKTIEITHEKKEHRKKISFRKKKNDSELEIIMDSCPKNASESEYLANIIYSYLKEPQNEREKIIYKDIVEKLNDSIKNKQKIRLKTKFDNKIQIIDPKEICSSQEGIYNYLLYQVYNEEMQKYLTRTIHIYNILYVHLDPEPSIFQPHIKEQFKKMKRNGVQFSINDDIIYKVKLTDQGKNLFKLRYLERPEPLSGSDKDNGIYYFNCSEMQFKSYFAPFRKEMKVLEPKEMVEEIVQEYMDAINNYKRVFD